MIAGVSSMSKADIVRSAGADEVVDLSADNLRDGLREQIYAVNGGNGVDVVIDSLGDRFFAAALRAMAWCGRLVVVGFAAETSDLLENARKKLLAKNLDMIVANDISEAGAGFDVETNRVRFLLPDGEVETLPLLEKSEVAHRLLDRIRRLRG